MFGCQHGRAPQYLIDYCLPVSDVASQQHLRSASRHLLVVLRHRLSTYGRRAFAVARWPDGLELFPGYCPGSGRYCRQLQALVEYFFCSQRISAISALDVSRRCALQIYILL